MARHNPTRAPDAVRALVRSRSQSLFSKTRVGTGKVHLAYASCSTSGAPSLGYCTSIWDQTDTVFRALGHQLLRRGFPKFRVPEIRSKIKAWLLKNANFPMPWHRRWSPDKDFYRHGPRGRERKREREKFIDNQIDD